MERVFVDANVLFSAAYKPHSPLRALWTLPDVTLLTSPYAMEEARRNLARVRPVQVPTLEQLIAVMTVVPPPAAPVVIPEGITLKDKDWPILLAAIGVEAQY